MMLRIPSVLSKDDVARCRAVMDRADWTDGRATSGEQSALVKNNGQLPENSQAANELGDLVMDALSRCPLFISAALPLKVFPPIFNRYAGGEYFGDHIDGAIRPILGTPHRVRTDLSATLFLTEPEDYDGGELVVQDTFGEHRAKFAAGDMVLYPGSSLHRVTEVTRGARVSSIMWIQSMVRLDADRTLLYQLDTEIQRLAAEKSHRDASVVALTGIYHNLLRRLADA